MKYYNRNLTLLAGMYTHISLLYADKNGNISLSKEKKIRRLINKSYLSQLPPEIKKELSDYVAFADILLYLKNQKAECERMLEQQDEELRSVAEELCPDEVSIIEMLMSSESLFFLSKNDSVEITIRESYSYSCCIILPQVEVTGTLPAYLPGDCLGYCELSKCGKLYCIELVYYDCDDESNEEQCKIAFSAVKVKKERYNAMQTDCSFETPWDYLCSVAEELLYCKGAGCELNNMEKNLMSIAEALKNLESRGLTADYSALYELAEESGFSELRRTAAKKLPLKLNDKRFEPFWRYIHSRFEQSQAQYPCKADVCCDRSHIENTRMIIIGKLNEFGFAGEYPDFYKSSSISGPKLVASYGRSYFVAHEKNVIHHIKCIESYDGDLRITFICGTICLRNGESAMTDAFSCMFNAKGRCSFRIVRAECPQTVPEYMEGLPPISKFIEVAAKKALQIKMTKEERKNVWFADLPRSSTTFLIVVWMIAGVLFGLCMTVGFMVIEFLACVIIQGSISAFPGLFMNTPWWLVFLGCAVPFIVMMSVVTTIGNKK